MTAPGADHGLTAPGADHGLAARETDPGLAARETDPGDENRTPTADRPTGSGTDDLPRTGEAEVDRALDGLQGLESAPLAEHHDRLAQVHEDLHRALNPQQEQP